MTERKAMIDKSHKAPVTTQCRLLELNRSTVYYQAQDVSEADLEVDASDRTDSPEIPFLRFSPHS